MASPPRSEPENASVARHLARGAVGFGLIGSAFGLTASRRPAALLLAPAGLVVLRGCPACWLAGLIETVSAGRLRCSCDDGGCMLEAAASAKPPAATRSVSACDVQEDEPVYVVVGPRPGELVEHQAQRDVPAHPCPQVGRAAPPALADQ